MIEQSSFLWAALALAACKPPESPKPPVPMFGEYFETIVREQAELSTGGGRVPPLVAKLPTSLALTERIDLFPSKLLISAIARVTSGTICFEKIAVGDPSTSGEALAQRELETMKTRGFAIRAIASLAAERDHPVWPAPTEATSLMTVEVIKSGVEDIADRQTKRKSSRRVATLELCGPLPKITSETKFLVVTERFAEELVQIDEDTPISPTRASEAYAVMLIAITDGELELR